MTRSHGGHARAKACVGAVLACTAVAAGCGSTKKAITRFEYAQRADAICAPYNRETARLRGNATGVNGVATLAERTLPLLDRTVARLRRLPPPRDTSALARRWLALLDRLRGDVVRIRDAARANDLATLRRVALAAQSDNEASNALAQRLGMAACSAG